MISKILKGSFFEMILQILMILGSLFCYIAINTLITVKVDIFMFILVIAVWYGGIQLIYVIGYTCGVKDQQLKNKKTKKIKLSNMDRKIQGLISKFHDFRFGLTLDYFCFKHDWKIKLKYMFLCNNGYHYTTRCTKSISGYGYKKEVSIEYLECQICNKKFFTNLKEKKKYLKHFRDGYFI